MKTSTGNEYNLKWIVPIQINFDNTEFHRTTSHHQERNLVRFGLYAKMNLIRQSSQIYQTAFIRLCKGTLGNDDYNNLKYCKLSDFLMTV